MMDEQCLYCGKKPPDIEDKEVRKALSELRFCFKDAAKIFCDGETYYVDYAKISNDDFAGNPIRMVFHRKVSKKRIVKWRIVEMWVCVGEFSLRLTGSKWSATPWGSLRESKYFSDGVSPMPSEVDKM